MPMLKSISSHAPCSTYIQNYLQYRDGEERTLGMDFVNVMPEDHARWAARMDETRSLEGNDAAWGGKQAVTYRHFIVSPDPADGIGLEELRGLALEWAVEMFGDELGAGRLGCFEVAIAYHDDNANGIPHAHVIVNNTDLETGRRLQIKNDDVAMLADRLQEIAAERGLSHFDNTREKDKRRYAERNLTRAERKLVKEDRWSWKQDMADRIDVARHMSRDRDGFVKRLGMLGIEAAEKNGDYLYSNPANERWAAYGSTLGAGYRLADVSVEMATRQAKPTEREADNIAAFLASARTVGYATRDVTLGEVARCLRTNERYGIACEEDYEKVARSMAIKLARAEKGSARHEEIKAAYAEVAYAKAIAERGSFFAGVEERARPEREKDPQIRPRREAEGAAQERAQTRQRTRGRQH